MKSRKPTNGKLVPVTEMDTIEHRSWRDICREMEIYWDSKSLSNDSFPTGSERIWQLERENARLKEVCSSLRYELQVMLDLIKLDVDRIKGELRIP